MIRIFKVSPTLVYLVFPGKTAVPHINFAIGTPEALSDSTTTARPRRAQVVPWSVLPSTTTGEASETLQYFQENREDTPALAYYIISQLYQHNGQFARNSQLILAYHGWIMILMDIYKRVCIEAANNNRSIVFDYARLILVAVGLFERS